MNKELEGFKKSLDTMIGNQVDVIGMSLTRDTANLLASLLTPPKADEVCKAFGECYKQQVYYLKDNYHNGFHFKDSWFIVKFEDGVVHFTVNSFIMANSLPPHLITLIGKFYEGGVKK